MNLVVFIGKINILMGKKFYFVFLEVLMLNVEKFDWKWWKLEYKNGSCKFCRSW